RVRVGGDGLAECVGGGHVLGVVIEGGAPLHGCRRREAASDESERGKTERRRPHALHSHGPPSARRSISNAICADCHFTAARSPENRKRRAGTLPATATPMETVPPGFFGLPPAAPAMPVMRNPHRPRAAAQIPPPIPPAE